MRGKFFLAPLFNNFSLFLIDLQLLKSEVGVEKQIIKNQSLNRKQIGNEAELRYQYSFGKNNCLTITGKNYLQLQGR